MCNPHIRGYNIREIWPNLSQQQSMPRAPNFRVRLPAYIPHDRTLVWAYIVHVRDIKTARSSYVLLLCCVRKTVSTDKRKNNDCRCVCYLLQNDYFQLLPSAWIFHCSTLRYSWIIFQYINYHIIVFIHQKWEIYLPNDLVIHFLHVYSEYLTWILLLLYVFISLPNSWGMQIA